VEKGIAGGDVGGPKLNFGKDMVKVGGTTIACGAEVTAEVSTT
jgi:hypothetical protein